jgi:tetratricopeptide (TPR) repeat protein
MREGKSDDWRFKVYHAWARFNRDFRRDATAERQMEAVFQAALEADPGFVDVYLLQGKHYRRLEQWAKAKAKFDRVIQLDPSNREAMRELRLISQRLDVEGKAKDIAEKKPAKPGSEGKGIFRSLFGRKQE